eukprot:scaffold622_cov188-Pinguiococcus_pyrenoidosus.AAC.2
MAAAVTLSFFARGSAAERPEARRMAEDARSWVARKIDARGVAGQFLCVRMMMWRRADDVRAGLAIQPDHQRPPAPPQTKTRAVVVP